MPQLVTRVDEDLAAAVDELVLEGVVASRSDAVRIALLALVDENRRSRIGKAIVSGYEAQPQSATEVGWADEASQRMIADEPW